MYRAFIACVPRELLVQNEVNVQRGLTTSKSQICADTC